MIYIGITAAIFLLDFFLKKYVDGKYELRKKHRRCNGKVEIEKYYNDGATLNLLAKHPKVMTAIHTVMMVLVLSLIHISEPTRP